MLNSLVFRRKGNFKKIQLSLQAFYSRRSNSNHGNSFKIVGKASDNIDELTNSSLRVNPNWELFAPQGFRFYLPGNIGPAWQDATSTAHITNSFSADSNSILECTAQECPILLRQGIYELFPGIETASSQLTVVTLSQKPVKSKQNAVSEMEIERLTKHFVLAAQDICSKLKLAGYWADFINPFSGLPYLSPMYNNKLYVTDERFRCLGFRIFDKGQCRVISDKTVRNFVGNLFTNAPPSTSLLKNILQQYDD